ncbi:MAG: hypothetical protein ACXQT1_01470 [Methermicoccaceae archaeon]
MSVRVMHMLEQKEGFVMGNPTRKKVVSLLAGQKSPVESKTLSKLGHIVEPVCKRTLEELAENGLVAHGEGGYALTEEGLTVYRMILST